MEETTDRMCRFCKDNPAEPKSPACANNRCQGEAHDERHN